MEIPEPLVRRLLEMWPVARLATLRSDGRPHLVPIVFAAWDGALWSPVDGKPKRSAELARLGNVRRDPRVSLLLDRYDPDWTRLWWIRVDGRASVHPRASAVPEAFDAAASALRAKYPQYAQTPLFLGPPTLLRLEPERTASWCAGEAALADLRDR